MKRRISKSLIKTLTEITGIKRNCIGDLSNFIKNWIDDGLINDVSEYVQDYKLN